MILSIANRRSSIKTINIAEINPNFPISVAISSNLCYKGVESSPPPLSNAEIFPTQLESPTTNTNIFPSPDNTLVPLNNIGDGTSCLPD